jgi:hypothetical protein
MAKRKTNQPKQHWWSAATAFLKESAALVSAVVVLIGAAAALIKILDGGDDGKKESSKGQLPVVARLAGPNDVSERAFFTQRGDMLVSTQYANQPGLSVHWRGSDGDRTARVRVVARSDVSTGFTLLRLVDETGPERRFRIRNGAPLKAGERVTAYISPDQTTDGKVLANGAEIEVEGVGSVGNLIVVGEVGGETEGGTPLIDTENRVRGMLFAQEEGIGKTFVIPIEDIRKRFPEAFD